MYRTLFVPSSRRPAEPWQVSSNNLPAQLTPLVGRERAVAAACTLLRRPEVRLLTLTGTGGIGKTRLGLEVAVELFDDFADGVSFIPLAPISDPEFVVPAISQMLGLTEIKDRLLFDQLKAYLQDKRLLLLLDNFEQVVAAAPLLTDLLTACPELKLLVTSRTLLRVRGEHEFPISPLALPDLKHLPDMEALSQYAAVALFMQRALALKPDFQLTPANARAIAQICARLDGLPLAIELAAARIKLFPPEALLKWLGQWLHVLTRGVRDVPMRQQTLRNTFMWSYDLLDAQEQRLFRRLSIFVGGCSLKAVEAVCTAPGDITMHMLDGVASLIDKSLLQQTQQEGDEPRLGMLETMREYGQECLENSGEMEMARRAHADYFLALAKEAEPELDGMRQAIWLERLERELENLRAVLRWLEEQGEVETALQLGGALWRFWWTQGYWSEGRNFLVRMLARSEGVAVAVRAKALNAAGVLAFFQGDAAVATTLCREGLELFRELSDARGIATSLYRLGQIAWMKSDFEIARSLGEEALAFFREVGDTQGIGDSLLVLGYISMDQREYVRANSLIEESLALFRVMDNKGGIAASLVTLARVSFFQEDLTTAYALVQKFLVPSLEMNDMWSYAHSFAILLFVAFVQGEYAKAESLGEEALILLKGGIAASLATLARVSFSQDDLATAHILMQKLLVPSKEMGDPMSILLSLAILAYVAFLQGDYTMARAMSEETIAIWTELGNREAIALATYSFAWQSCAQGDYAKAYAEYEESLAIAKTLGNGDFLALFPEGLAAVAAAHGQTQWAVELLGTAEPFRQTNAIPLSPVADTLRQQLKEALRAMLGEKAFAEAWSEGRSRTAEQTVTTQEQPTMRAPLAGGTSSTPAPAYPVGLTAREVEVLRLASMGLTNIQVAEKLVISSRTVSTHLSSIYNKLGVTSRSAATRFAVEHHLV